MRTVLAILAALAVLAAGLYPAFAYRVGTPGLERSAQPGPRRVILLPIGEPAVAPLSDMREGAQAFAAGESLATTLWPRRVNYPYALALLWLIALLVARGRRHGIGWLLVAVSALVLVLEWAYLHSDYQPMVFHQSAGAEAWIAWGFVTLVLVLRPHGRWHPRNVTETVGAQATLGALHMLTLPTTMVRDWIGERSIGEILEVISQNFGPGYWYGLAGMCALAVLGWLPHPWRSRSSEASEATTAKHPAVGIPHELPSTPG